MYLLIFCRGTMKLKPETNNLNILNLRPHLPIPRCPPMSGERRAVSEEAARRSSASVSFSTRTKQPPPPSAASSDADTVGTTHAPSYKTLTGAEWELRNFVFVLFWWPRSSHISAEHSHDYFISDSEIQRTANLRRFHAKRGMKNTLQVCGLNFIFWGKHFPSYLSM